MPRPEVASVSWLVSDFSQGKCAGATVELDPQLITDLAIGGAGELTCPWISSTS